MMLASLLVLSLALADKAPKAPKARFCLGGHAAAFGDWRICCPGSCGGCAETDACRTAKPGALACCPISGVLATRRPCRRRKDDACVARASDRRFFAAFAAAPRASTDAPRSRDDDAAAEAPRTNAAPVHVALAGDHAHYAGLSGAVASLFAAAADPARLRAHVVVPARGSDEVAALRAALACAAGPGRGAQVAVVPFDADRYLANVTLSAPRGPSYGNLRSPLNFARFYLADLLPDADRVVYLDADAVAVRDVADLYDGAFSGSASSVVAAAPRDQRVCYDRNASRPGVFYCDDAAARAALAALGFPNPEADLEAFNAGVLALHLGRWRSLGLTARFEDLMRAHAATPLWRLGSNPPLILIAARGRFEALDPRWNCDGLGWKRPGDLEPTCLGSGAFVWHWSGPRKPWARRGLYRQLWWPHAVDARCLAALPYVPLPEA